MILLSILLLISWGKIQCFHSSQRWSCPGSSLMRPTLIMKAAVTPPILTHSQSLQLLKNTVVTKIGTISAVMLPRLMVWTRRYLIALSFTFLFMFITNSTVRNGVADLLLYPFRRLFKGKRSGSGQEEDRNIHADFYNGNVGDKDDTPPNAQQITVTGKGYNTIGKEVEVEVEVEKQPTIAAVINPEKQPAAIVEEVPVAPAFSNPEIAWAKKKRDELEASRKAALERGRIREEAARKAEVEAAKEAEKKQIQQAKKAKQQAENDARMMRRKEEEAIAQKKLEAEEMAKKQRREAEKATALRRVAELRLQEMNETLLTKKRIEEQAKARAEQAAKDAVAKQIALSQFAAIAPSSTVTVAKSSPIVAEPSSTTTAAAAAVTTTNKPAAVKLSRGLTKEFTYNPNVPNFDGNLSPANSASLLKNTGVVKVADIQIRQESTTSTNESSFEIQNVVRSISSLYDQFLGNLLTPLNEVSNMPNEDNSGVSGVSVVSVSDDDDDSRVGSEGISSEQVKSRNYSPFQETEKAAAVRKQAMLQQQEVTKQRDIAGKKSRSFSPFPKKQSSSPSSKLPYSASKVVDDTEVQSLSSLYDKFLGNLIHELTPQSELSNVQKEVSIGDDDGSVDSAGDERDDGKQQTAVETRNFSPFQETEKAAAVRKQAMLQEQEANVRRLRQQEINETLAQKLRIERNVAEQKSRSFSPFPKKQSSSPSSKLPYSASKIVDDAVVDACADEDATASELGVSSEMNPEVVQVWTPGKMVRQ